MYSKTSYIYSKVQNSIQKSVMVKHVCGLETTFVLAATERWRGARKLLIKTFLNTTIPSVLPLMTLTFIKVEPMDTRKETHFLCLNKYTLYNTIDQR